ncbi:MAG: GntR family transcriptional regulator [Propionicimonas sp.]
MGRRRSTDIAAMELPAELSPDRPRGDQIRESLEALATRLGPGATIPSDRQLAEHFGVARMTVRTEIKRLVIDGVLEVEHGRGTFVARAPRLAPEWGTSYTLAARAAKGKPQTTLLESTRTGADAGIAELLRIAEGAPVLTLTRLRALDGRPVGIERVTIPLDRFPGLDEVDLESVSLYEVLAERWGLVRAASTGRAAATLPSEADASLLAVTVRDPCLVVQMVSTDIAGAVFEVGRSVYRADRYEIGIHLLHRSSDA